MTSRDWLYRALRHPSFLFGAALTGTALLLALVSLVWTPWHATDIDILNKLKSPGSSHWLGTDHLGRDIFSMLMVGARISIIVGLLAVAIGFLVGVTLGLVASARRGLVEESIMRLMDFNIAFPIVLTAILITVVLGPGTINSIIAIGVFNIPVFARISRAAGNPIWSRDFILAARVAGKGLRDITLEHILPNISGVLVVQATIQFAYAILAEAALSYLGFGTQPPTPSWGRMLSEGQTYAYMAPHVAIIPGVAIMTVVLGLNLIGDGLRDLLDPKLAPT